MLMYNNILFIVVIFFFSLIYINKFKQEDFSELSIIHTQNHIEKEGFQSCISEPVNGYIHRDLYIKMVEALKSGKYIPKGQMANVRFVTKISQCGDLCKQYKTCKSFTYRLTDDFKNKESIGNNRLCILHGITIEDSKKRTTTRSSVSDHFGETDSILWRIWNNC